MTLKNEDIEKDVQRLFWRFGKGNFTPNQNDVDALTRVATRLKELQEHTLHDQQLFAKCYTMLFTEKVRKLGLAFAKEHMEMYLPLSLGYHMKEFNFHFNITHYLLYCKKVGIEVKPEEYKTKEEKELMDWHIKNDKQYEKYLLGYWSEEKTTKSLTKDILDFVAKYKNKN